MWAAVALISYLGFTLITFCNNILSLRALQTLFRSYLKDMLAFASNSNEQILPSLFLFIIYMYQTFHNVHLLICQVLVLELRDLMSSVPMC